MWLSGKESVCNAGDVDSIPELESSSGEVIGYPFQDSWASLVFQTVKNPPAMLETWFQSLGWEDSLEEGMAMHSSIHLQIPWIIEKVGEFQKNMWFCFIDYTEVFDCVDHIKLWKILQEIVIPDHLTCLLSNLYAGQEATVRIGHGTTHWFQNGKGVHHALLSSCLFKLYAEYIMRYTELDEAQA